MTGYGRAETDHAGTKFSVELNSVNRKQSDIVINLPRDLAELEAALGPGASPSSLALVRAGYLADQRLFLARGRTDPAALPLALAAATLALPSGYEQRSRDSLRRA